MIKDEVLEILAKEKQEILKKIDTEQDEDMVSELVFNEYDLYGELRRKEIRECLIWACSKMTVIERKAFCLWCDGYTYKEIAAKTNGNQKQVDNVILRVKNKLLHKEKDKGHSKRKKMDLIPEILST